jgi:putative methyltransferase (TIGR04325 family)
MVARTVRKLVSPLFRPLIARVQHERFLSPSGLATYDGVFSDFKSARARMPREDSPGFEATPSISEYIEIKSKKAYAYDYPVIWWLQRALESGASTIMDIGGSVGVHYHAYEHYMAMPGNLTWLVVELAPIVAIGRELAAKRGSVALSFTDDLKHAVTRVASDIWISIGALQYVEHARPARLLKACRVRPKHILFNKLPLYDGEDFVTLQNIGEGAYAPVYVYNATRFIQDIESFGYTLLDRWEVPERSMLIPGHPERSFPSFSGLYFADPDSPLIKQWPHGKWGANQLAEPAA